MGESAVTPGEWPCCASCAVPPRSPGRVKEVSASRKTPGWHAPAIPLPLSYAGKEGHLARGQCPLGQPVPDDWSMWGQTVGLLWALSMPASPFLPTHAAAKSLQVCWSPINPLHPNPLPESASHGTQQPWARSGNRMPAGLPWPPLAYQNLFQYFPLPSAFTLTEWFNL